MSEYLKQPHVQRFKDMEIVRGNDNFHGVSIEDALRASGPWYVLLRAHDHIWKNIGFPFQVRWEASHQLWLLCNEVHHDQGLARKN